MGFLDALKSVGSAVIDTALLPVDIVVDAASGEIDDPNTLKRVTKITDELEEAYDQTLEVDEKK